jgi:cysteine desulfurase
MTDDEPIYLDYHATTPVADEVREAMLPYLGEKFGNPSSTDHRYGSEAKNAVDDAREEIASLVGSRTEEIIFTSGATEADNLALIGCARGEAPEGGHFVTTQIEHKAILKPAKWLEGQGWDVTYLEPDREGWIDPADVEDAIRDDTFLVSVMVANNEVGTIQPVEEIGQITTEHDVIFHSDAAQAVGHVPVDVEEMGIDLMSFSAHKMYGPKGIGALYVRRRNPKVHLDPQLRGGGHERGMRSGTLNVPAAIGFGKAADLASNRDLGRENEVSALRDQLYRELNEIYQNLEVNGPSLHDSRLPQNLNVSFPPLENQAIIRLISDRLACSTGSACETDTVQESHVLKAMDLNEERIHSSLRFGLGRDTTAEEIRFSVDTIASAINRLRALV